ncbi:helix-turn-helix domain-containing protein [Nocardia gipuzkoensis]
MPRQGLIPETLSYFVVYERLAADLGVTVMTVGKWRKRFARSRLDGLRDAGRPGRPKSELVLTGEERGS